MVKRAKDSPVDFSACEALWYETRLFDLGLCSRCECLLAAKDDIVVSYPCGDGLSRGSWCSGYAGGDTSRLALYAYIVAESQPT